MRTKMWVGLVALAAGAVACTTFTSDDTVPDAPDGLEADASNEGGVGGGADGGAVVDDSIRVKVPASEVRIVQGQSVEIDVTLERAPAATGAVTVTVTGLRDGVTADALVVVGAKGTLVIHAALGAAQGPIDAVVHATLEGRSHAVTKPLKLFVRGPAGSLDTTFGDGGYYLEERSWTTAGSLVIGPQDSIYASFGNNVRRLFSDGSFDTTYGDKGLAIVASEINLLNQNAALTADGGLLFAGSFRADTPQHGFGKLTPSGAPDPSFGDGKWGAGSRGVPKEAGGEAVGSFVPLQSGNILFAAEPHIGPLSGPSIPLNLLDSTGKPVPSFGTNGRQNFSFFRVGPNQSYIYLKVSKGSLLERKDGSILLRGMVTEEDSSATYWGLCNLRATTGEVNPWFGQFGCIAIPASTLGALRDVEAVELADGKIAAVFTDWASKWSILRLTANGDIDTSFGKNGWSEPVSTPDGWSIKSWVPLSDGFLITEQRRFENNVVADAFVRVTSSGSLDATFGQGGRVELDNRLVEGVSFYGISHVGRSSDDKIVVRGNKILVEDSHGYNPTEGPMFIARYWN